MKMNPIRGDIWLANLEPTRGSEQAGSRPVLVLQNNDVSKIHHYCACHAFNDQPATGFASFMRPNQAK